MTALCRACRAPLTEAPLDPGPQPLCNRFLSKPDEAEPRFPLILGVCPACGLVQLVSAAPTFEVRPRFPWISYNEPEGHLDRMVERLGRLPGLAPGSLVAGVTFKDDSTLRRFREKGFRTVRLDPVRDLGIAEENAGIETIQEEVTADALRRAAHAHGAPDLVIVRHILEHVHDLAPFMEALRAWVKPEGLVVFEAPDCQRALEKRDYSALWEEHLAYFTPETFRAFFGRFGFAPELFEVYPYSLENSLVAVLRRGPSTAAAGGAPPAEIERFRRYRDGFAPQTRAFRERIERLRASGPLAFLGAGHLSAMCINLNGLGGLIDVVVEDNPNKQGLFMPGSRLPIEGSEALVRRGIRLCLMGVSPENEPVVLSRQKPFLSAGGRLASIFPDSAHALTL